MAETISLHSMKSSTQNLTSRTSSDDNLTLTTPQKQHLDGIAAGPQSTAAAAAAAAPAAAVLPKSLALKQLVGAAVTLLVLFWANTSWIMGKMVCTPPPPPPRDRNVSIR